MKVLLLVMAEQRVILDRLYAAIGENVSHCDIVRLNSDEQVCLRKVFSRYRPDGYDRVVIFSRLKKQVRQLGLLRAISGLVILEHDACQNYMPDSKYFGKYLAFYKRLPGVRVIVSSVTVAERFRNAGVDAVFVSKGYDEALLYNKECLRDIPAAFVGSTGSQVYRGRAELLRILSERAGVFITRTESGVEYLEMLNRIKVFVSADVGMHEYMIKNFEAMACGCALLAWRQGGDEDRALGFLDGENVMLYNSVDEALEKLQLLISSPSLLSRIAQKGQALVQERFPFSKVGCDLAMAISEPMVVSTNRNVWQKKWARLRYGI